MFLVFAGLTFSAASKRSIPRGCVLFSLSPDLIAPAFHPENVWVPSARAFPILPQGEPRNDVKHKRRTAKPLVDRFADFLLLLLISCRFCRCYSTWRAFTETDTGRDPCRSTLLPHRRLVDEALQFEGFLCFSHDRFPSATTPILFLLFS